jgi:Ca2+-binding RTX toxin-like protein
MGGDDFITGGTGDDTLQGGTGTDTVNYSDLSGGVQVDLVLGTAQGAGGNDTLVSIEQVFGSSGNDVLKGGATVNGSAATDGFEGFRGNQGDDIMDGGAGFDRVTYDNSPFAVSVTLGGSSPGTGRDGWRSNNNDSTSDGTDTLINIEEVRGSDKNDTLTGSNEADRYESFEGRAGNDTIDGRGGTDRATYQNSPFAVNVNLALETARDGWRSNNTVPGSDGADVLIGIEEVRGSNFNDTIVGCTGNNWLEGRAGDDSIVGGLGSDSLFGEAGNDTLDGGEGEDFVIYRSSTAAVVVDLTKTTGQVQDGLGGVDTLISIEGVIGSSQGDQFLGPQAATPYFYVEGAGGADTIDGGTGALIREVGFTFDTAGVTVRLAGWVGATGALPTGYTGSALDCTGSIDVFRNIQNIEGSKFNDFLYGDANDNSIDGRGGSDFIDGGEGSDTIEFNQAAAGISVDLSRNLVLDDGQGIGSAAANAAVEQDTLASIENVDGGGFDDLIVGDGVGNLLNGQGGNDTLTGGGGNDVINGGDGIDLAKYVGDFNDYDVDFDTNTGVLTLTHNVSGGGDGVDAVSNVERFQFADLFYVLDISKPELLVLETGG